MNMLVSIVCLCSAVAMADSPLPADSIESMRVHKVIRGLERAIKKADPAAYMALIDHSDSFFVTEQRAWVTDLTKHPVEDVSVSIAWNEPVRIQSDGSAIAPIEISWHVPGEELDRHFAYEAFFVPLGAPNGQWAFAGRAWEVELVDIPDVRVYSDAVHEDLAYLAGDRVGVLRAQIEENLGFSGDDAPEDKQEIVVKIYPDMSSLQASIYLSYTDSLSGWNEPGESIKILGRDQFSQEMLDPLLAHEIGHAVSFGFGEHIIDAPWWALEGIAEVAAGLFRDSADAKRKRMVQMAKRDDLRDWKLLADFRGEANNHMRHVYLQGWSMIDYIDQAHGINKRNQWFKVLAAGASLDEASTQTFGIGFDQLDINWRRSLVEAKASGSD